MPTARGTVEASQRRLATNEAVVAAEVGEQAILLHVDNGVYFQLDLIGARVWSLLVGGHDVGAIVSMLSDEYDVEIGELRQDIEDFLERMIALDLVRMADL